MKRRSRDRPQWKFTGDVEWGDTGVNGLSLMVQFREGAEGANRAAACMGKDTALPGG